MTLVRAAGSTPRSAGARMIVFPDGRIEGSIGGGKVEHQAFEAAQEALARGESQLLEFKLTAELGMCCGGQVSVFIEPMSQGPLLILFGAGHVGAALARSAASAGFSVHVADERSALLHAADLSLDTHRYELLDDPDLPFGAEAYVMIATHDHGLDQRLLERCLTLPHRWLGVIGSRRKGVITRKRLAHKGFTDAQIAEVRIPVGLAIGAETPQEIAVSILAELIAVRRGAALLGESEQSRARLETKPPPDRSPLSEEETTTAK